MNLNPIKANMTELVLNDYKILFSYRTPVACIDRRSGEGFYTSYKWSRTTTRHINQWLAGRKAEEKPQEFFDQLIAEVE